uniref:Putative secreted protein n=1 Tax=Anopheles darlingi TaxID=43151 RepID=A0A2M4DE11_ANODA
MGHRCVANRFLLFHLVILHIGPLGEGVDTEHLVGLAGITFAADETRQSRLFAQLLDLGQNLTLGRDLPLLIRTHAQRIELLLASGHR